MRRSSDTVLDALSHLRRMLRRPDRFRQLTRRQGRPIFSDMRRANPMSWLLRAASLTVMGFLLSGGAAAAHDGHVSHRDQSALSAPSVSVASERLAVVSGRSDVSTATEDPTGQAEIATRHSVPCSDDQSAGHHGAGCCTFACHAALAALPIGPMTIPDRPSMLLVGIFDRLDSRSGDRTERPPKLI